MADIQLKSLNLPNDNNNYYFTDEDAQEKLSAMPVWTVNTETHKIVLTQYEDGNSISY